MRDVRVVCRGSSPAISLQVDAFEAAWTSAPSTPQGLATAPGATPPLPQAVSAALLLLLDSRASDGVNGGTSPASACWARAQVPSVILWDTICAV